MKTLKQWKERIVECIIAEGVYFKHKISESINRGFSFSISLDGSFFCYFFRSFYKVWLWYNIKYLYWNISVSYFSVFFANFLVIFLVTLVFVFFSTLFNNFIHNIYSFFLCTLCLIFFICNFPHLNLDNTSTSAASLNNEYF